MADMELAVEDHTARVNWIVEYAQFNLVGVLGFLAQLGSLAVLYHLLSWHYLISTLLSVELAVLHNFLWHERWTWRGRSEDPFRRRFQRLGQFQLANGLVSLVINTLLTYLLVELARLPVLGANLVAVILCSVVNYLLSREIFRAR